MNGNRIEQFFNTIVEGLGGAAAWAAKHPIEAIAIALVAIGCELSVWLFVLLPR